MDIATVAFTDARYEKLRETYRKWWGGTLGRPIVAMSTWGHKSCRQPSPHPCLTFDNSWDMSITPEQFIDAEDYRLSTMRWHAEGFPYCSMTPFGPGVLAAFLGCTPVNGSDTVWFMPPREDIPIEELHFEFDENNPYYRRVLHMYELAMEKWHGMVVVGMVDMGGIMDVLSSFRGVENLLMDLYDSPEEVQRCIKELQDMWFLYFDKFNAVMAPEARGYSQWFNMYDEKPGYILQSDFSYMIGPDLFDEFVAPELASSAARLYNPIYHMDGVGQIPHLESLLAIDEIKGIQWVHGSGEPATRDWSELALRILDSGKKLMSYNERPDGSPTPLAKDPCQVFIREHGYHCETQLQAAKDFLAIYGMELNLD